MKLDVFIKRPVLSTVISIILVILGLLGLSSLPITQYPDVAPPTIQVSTTYTGANAETVLNSVITPLEEQINGVEGMTYMTSSSSNDGSATITVYFKLGTDPDMAAVNVQNRVSQAASLLPAEVTKVGVTTQKRMTSMLMVFTVYSENPDFDEAFVQNYTKINIIPALKRVNGVGDAMAWGSKDYSMRIWLKPDAMAKYGLAPTEIANAIGQQNIEAAPGKFGQNSNMSFQYPIKWRGRLKNVEEFENIVVRADQNGNILRLKDVARIELGGLDYSISSRSQGFPAVSCAVFQTPGSNATAIVEALKKELKLAEEDFPKGIKWAPVMDTTDFLFASIDKVVETIIEAFILVFIVVYVFLQDFRSTLIPAIAVIVSLVGTFFFLKLAGFSLNLLTLFALVLAIAIVVDDAIVVVEAVHAKLDQGYKSPLKASLDAMSEISGAIVSITLVMSAVFIPVTFVGGTTGVFYTQFGITLAIAILISALNALTLSPALCAIFLSAKEEHGKGTSIASRFHKAFNTAFNTTTQKYRSSVGKLIKHKWFSLIAVALFGGIMYGLMAITPTGLVPNEDNGVIMMDVSMAPGTSLERTGKVLEQIDAILAAEPTINSRTMINGMGLISGNGSSYGTFICQLKPWSERTAKGTDLNSVIGKLYMMTAGLKDAQIMIIAPPAVSGFGMSGGFEFSLQDRTGGDIGSFYQVYGQFAMALNQRPEIKYAMSSFNPSFPQYEVEIDANKAAMAGTSPSAILTALQYYYGGAYTSNINQFGKLYRVMIQSDYAYRSNTEGLNNVFVKTNSGEMAPVSNFVNLKRVYGPENITRFNLFTSIALNGAVADGYSTGDAINAIKEVADQVLPVGYSYDFSGLTREEQSASNQLGGILFLCIIFVYFILCAQYESYILPLAVILSLPLGLSGSFIFAKIMGVSNDIYLQISLIMLIGLLAKNAILIVQFAVARRQSGETLVQSAIDGATARLRPILMTSFAMIIGLLPLMFSTGVGANGNSTIGTGAVGGMLVGTILQLFIVPALFVIFQGFQERFKKNDPEAAEL
ncbi:MAG: efflux RND transporter permease subunit [Flavobacteriales bacterium]|nr:efflux RND transporter permease subunit [Flavobacteriales bacterium]